MYIKTKAYNITTIAPTLWHSGLGNWSWSWCVVWTNQLWIFPNEMTETVGGKRTHLAWFVFRCGSASLNLACRSVSAA